MQSQAYPVTPARTSAGAIWSLVLGILSMGCLWILGSIPAIILGAVAIKKINQSPQILAGKGLAIAGIVTGSLGVFTALIPIAILASSAMPAYNGIQERAKRTMMMNDVKVLLLGCRAYAADFEGAYPPSLDVLFPDYIDDETFLTHGENGPDEGKYLYRPGLTDTSSPTEILILGPEGRMGSVRVVGYVGGHVLEVREPIEQSVLDQMQ